MKIRKSNKRSLGAIFFLAYGTGAALYLLSRWVRVRSGIGLQHHPAEAWIRIAHTSATYVMLMALGYLIKSHVLPGLKAGKRLISGLTMLALLLIVSATAVGILYSGDGDWNSIFVQVHVWLGLIAPAPLVLHAARRIRHPVPLN